MYAVIYKARIKCRKLFLVHGRIVKFASKKGKNQETIYEIGNFTMEGAKFYENKFKYRLSHGVVSWTILTSSENNDVEYLKRDSPMAVTKWVLHVDAIAYSEYFPPGNPLK